MSFKTPSADVFIQTHLESGRNLQRSFSAEYWFYNLTVCVNLYKYSWTKYVMEGPFSTIPGHFLRNYHKKSWPPQLSSALPPASFLGLWSRLPCFQGRVLSHFLMWSGTYLAQLNERAYKGFLTSCSVALHQNPCILYWKNDHFKGSLVMSQLGTVNGGGF